jgi:aspartate aminotransferase/aminotransferase
MSSFPVERWIADRMKPIEASGIRKVFDLARSLKNPINLSIGQPDFDVPEPVKLAAKQAIDAGRNGYTASQGIPELRTRIADRVRKELGHADREVFLTSGTSGGLVLALNCVVNPGDEVVFFDPYFVAYPHLVSLVGGVSVMVDVYPDFDFDPARVKGVLTPRTKAILINSPANPTGRIYSRESLRDLARLAQERGILLISDEIYRSFCHDRAFTSPAEFNEDVLVLDGFSKSHGMTGWRLGFAHGPGRLIEEMIKLQQFTFVCAPSVVQYAGVAAWDTDLSSVVAEYRGKRDRVYNGLTDRFELVKSEGAFYLFPKAPWGSATEFVSECIRNELLLIPGSVFSRRDTHFRLSYAASDETLDRGLEILNRLARR